MTRLLCNPFFVYIMSFTLVLLVYSLGWSGLYPDLSFSLLLFFGISFIVSFVLGAFIDRLKRIEYKELSWNPRIKLYLSLVWAGYLLEFIYNRGIPLQLLLLGIKYDYTQFGIPTFHVFLATFSNFLSVYIFHQLISDFNRRRLVFFILSILPAVLIINRGMLFMTLTACLFVYLLSLGRISLKVLGGVVILILAVLYLFGIMGNLRQTDGRTMDSDYMLEASFATSSFRDSPVPKPYIWSYLYISSPLANLQNTILQSNNLDQSWLSFFNYEVLPDFISKRTGSMFEIPKYDMPRVAPWLTVSTFYARAYVFLGWIGIILMFIFFLTTTLVYVLILHKNSKYYITGLAILSTLVLYNTFDNMYSFSGINLQLVYPLILTILGSLKVGLDKKMLARDKA